jgi:hypothetical protein
MNLEVVGGVGWFNRKMEMKLGNGMETRFWKDTFLSNEPLGDCFPSLFSLTNDKDI